MGRDFPLPRSELPDFSLTDTEHQSCKEFASRMLSHTVNEFERFAYDENGLVSSRRWKSKAKRGDVTLYRERDVGSVGLTLADALHRCASQEPMFAPTAAALSPPTMLLSGTRQGFVENALGTAVTKNQEELALVVKFLHGDVADCAVLHTLEESTAKKPFHFLGFKFFVTESAADASIIKRRHSVYLEYTGLTSTRTGEVVGYHIMQSVALPGFPDLTSRNSVGALTSMRFIYRQKRDAVVEIFMLGNVSTGGSLIKPLAQMVIDEVTFGMTRLLDCSETKRLTQMAREYQWRKQVERRNGSTMRMGSSEGLGDTCSVCQRAGKSGFGGVRLVQCLICGHVACSRCRTGKRVFVSSNDGMLGKLIKVPTCSRCTMEANTSYFEARRARAGNGTLSDSDERPSPMQGLPAGWVTGKAPSTPGSIPSSSPNAFSLSGDAWVSSPRSSSSGRMPPSIDSEPRSYKSRISRMVHRRS